GGEPRTLGHNHALNTEQAHAAQDERHHGSREIAALRETASSDRAAVASLGAGIGQGMAANGIDDTGPARLLEWLAGSGEFSAVDDVGSAKLLEILTFRRLASDGDHGEASLLQQGDGEAANPAGGARD